MKMQHSQTAESVNSGKAIWVFTPSRTVPKDLEFIFVQRQNLLKDAVERVRESALTDHKHHLLFVGPRGCGKTHLVTLIVNRLAEDESLTDHLRIAWLNEDETCTTLLEFLLKIHAALEKRYPAEYSEEMLSAAYEMKQAAATEFVSQHLLSTLGSRTLLVVTENLDAIFERLGDGGQKQLRSFIQENPKLSIVATAQRLVEDLSNRNSPFFGFFQTEHLKSLTVEQANELLQNIAKLQNKHEVVEFLYTRRGHSRVRAIHHLSGGNHRIYIVLSQFITRDSVDALLEPFMKMVDELTPYYQERIRWLPPMQRKIVEYLCTCEGTVPVKEIAKRLFATSQTVSSQLQDLREKGYVEANQRGRESLYEISEPLMRICVEVKDNQRFQPLRLLVDFLRVWYDDEDLKTRVGKMDPSANACKYLLSAIQRNDAEGNLRQHILIENLATSLSEKILEEDRDALMTDAAQLPENAVMALHYWADGKITEAHACIKEELEAAEDQKAKDSLLHRVSRMLIHRGIIHGDTGETQRAISDYTAVIELPNSRIDQVALALISRGATFALNSASDLAFTDFSRVINLARVSEELLVWAYLCRGAAQSDLGNNQQSVLDFSNVISMENISLDCLARAMYNRGVAYSKLSDQYRAIDDYSAVICLPKAPIVLTAMSYLNRGVLYGDIGETNLAISDYSTLINLASAPIDQIAKALHNRASIHLKHGQKEKAQVDYESLLKLENLAPKILAEAHLGLSELHFREGCWNEGFKSLESSLQNGDREQPAYRATATDLIDVIFSAGLSLEGRSEKVAELLSLYQKYQALPVLGESVIQQIGSLYRSGEPFPSSDNLEGWKSAWEKEAESVPDFRLSIRLLSTSISFLKAGGKDRSILLDLASTERSIVEQALGIIDV